MSAGAIALLLAMAGASKVLNPVGTKESWSRHGVLQERVIAAVAWVIGPIELLVATGLIVPSTRVGGGVVAALLFATYAIYLALAVREGAEGGCACFGTDSAVPINRGHVARAVLFAALAVVVASDATETVDPVVFVLGLVTGLGLMMLSSLVTALVGNATRSSNRGALS